MKKILIIATLVLGTIQFISCSKNSDSTESPAGKIVATLSVDNASPITIVGSQTYSNIGSSLDVEYENGEDNPYQYQFESYTYEDTVKKTKRSFISFDIEIDSKIKETSYTTINGMDLGWKGEFDEYFPTVSGTLKISKIQNEAISGTFEGIVSGASGSKNHTVKYTFTNIPIPF